jgi:predicted transglutaminase-like cysteine proteinase
MSIEFNRILVDSLFPSTPMFPVVNNLVDLIKPKTDPSGLYSVLNNRYSYSYNNTYNPSGKLNGTDYREFLQMGNPQIKKLVASIVSLGDSNDTKVDKILNWVGQNITYVSDSEQYHRLEYWAKPTETLKSLKGDCEDQAFLVQSMVLSAGVPIDRVRTYGGLVKTGYGLGGHAWTIYKRQSDNKWVDLDTTFYADRTSVTSRQVFKAKDKYVDAYWWMNAVGTYDEFGKWGIDIYA